MKFELNFDKNTFHKQQKLNIDLLWKKNIDRNKKSLITGVVVFALGVFITYGGSDLGIFLLGYGLCYLIFIASYFYSVRQKKKEHFKLVEAEADRYLSKGNEMILEFNDDSFYYKGFDYETTIGWDTFKGFRVIDNSIFMDLNVGNTVSYIINESQVGEENFRKLIGFLGSKIKRN